eukprot:gene10759-11909_t
MNNTKGIIKNVCHGLKHIDIKITSLTKTTAYSIGVYNIAGSVFATITNALIIVALVKNTRLQTSVNVLTGNLCLTDFLVGSVVQPLFIALQVIGVNTNVYCTIRRIHTLCASICCGCSFTSLVLISTDRYLAVCHPYWYSSKELKWRYVTTVIMMWLLWITFTALPYTSTIKADTFFFVMSVVTFVCVLLVLFFYGKIYGVARAQIKQVSVGFHCEMFDIVRAKERRNAKTVGIILALFGICYLPTVIITFVSVLRPLSWQVIQIIAPCFESLIYQNSSLNPIIYCLRMSDIRKAVLKCLRNLHVGPIELQRVASTQQQTVLVHQTTILVQQTQQQRVTPTQQPAVPGRQQGVLAQQQKGATQQQIASAQATPTQQPAVPGRQQGVLAQQQKGATQQQIASAQATPTQQPAVPGPQQGVLAQQQKGATQQQIASAQATPTQQPAVPGRQQGVLAQQQEGATQQQIASAQATPTQQPAVPGRQQGVLAQQQKGAAQQQIASAQATPTQQPAVPGRQQGVLAQQQKGAAQQQIASTQATPTQQPAVPGRQQGVLAQQQKGAAQQQIASAQATPTQQPAVPGRQQNILAQQQKGAAQQQIASTQQQVVPDRQQAFAYTQPAAAIQPNLQQPIGNPKQTYPEATKSQQQPDLPVPANQQQRGSNATLQAAVVMCNINFTKVGCFNDFGIIPKPLPVKLLEDKNTGFSASGINSNNKAAWDTFLPDFICRCANAARERKFWTFGIQNYDECFSGHDEGRYDEDGQANTSKCKNNNGDICDEKSEYCAGDPSANFIYTVRLTDEHTHFKTKNSNKYSLEDAMSGGVK